MKGLFSVPDNGINMLVPNERNILRGKLFLYHQNKLITYGFGEINRSDNIIKFEYIPNNKFTGVIPKYFSYRFIPFNTLQFNMITGRCKAFGDVSISFEESELNNCNLLPILTENKLCDIHIDIREICK